jgi:general secretion pathway protein K
MWISARIRREHGFALLIVLWVLVLISFVTAQITAAGRTELRIAGNLAANAVGQAAADGAVYQAIFNLSDPRPERRWALDRAAHEIDIGRSRVTVTLEDEDALVNPSFASAALLEALLRVVGSDPSSAAGLANAIAEWVGSETKQRPRSAIKAEYAAAGLDYAPPGTPLESLDELGRVRGMTPGLLSALRPHLTLFGAPVPNRADADPEVAEALALSGETGPMLGASANGAIDMVTVRIHATAYGPGNARISRTAVARVGTNLPQGYTLLAWYGGDD